MFHRYDDKERLHVREPNKRRAPNPLRGYTGEHTAADSSVCDSTTNNVEIETTSAPTSFTTPTSSKASTSMSPITGNTITTDVGQPNDESSLEEESKDDDFYSESSDSDSDSEGVRGATEIIHDNGLTNSEHKILFERSSDASLPARERADAAVMMMMGVRRRSNFCYFQCSTESNAGYAKPFRSQR